MNLNIQKQRPQSLPGQVELPSESTIPSNSSFSNQSDLEIWRRFKKDDKAAFIHIYTRYFNVIYNYGFKMCNDEEIIKDCIHDVFAQINESKSRLSDVRNIKFYLLKSFKTRFIHYQKKEARFVKNQRGINEDHFEFSLSIEQKIINSQLDQEKINRLNKAIQQLPIRQREVIYYFFYEELSIDDIRELMEVGNRRTIQNLMYRAIASLKKSIPFLLLGFFMTI